jgi:hypothetical protein
VEKKKKNVDVNYPTVIILDVSVKRYHKSIRTYFQDSVLSDGHPQVEECDMYCDSKSIKRDFMKDCGG